MDLQARETHMKLLAQETSNESMKDLRMCHVPAQFVRVLLHKKYTILYDLRCDFDAYSARIRIKMPQNTRIGTNSVYTCFSS